MHSCLCFKVKTLVTRATQTARAVWDWKTKAGSSYSLSLQIMLQVSGGAEPGLWCHRLRRSVLKGPLCWQRSAQVSCLSCGSSHSRQHHEKDNTVFKLLHLTPLRYFWELSVWMSSSSPDWENEKNWSRGKNGDSYSGKLLEVRMSVFLAVFDFIFTVYMR